MTTREELRDVLNGPMREPILEYRDTLCSVFIAVRVLSAQPFERMLEAIARTESVAPFVDPTLWREKQEALAQDKAAMQAALAFLQHPAIQALLASADKLDSKDQP